jgi:hypothetical protein
VSPALPRAAAQTVRGIVMKPGAVRRIPMGVARGLRLEVDERAPVHIYLGTAEIEIARHIRALARPGTQCFDVGSHNAYYSLTFARLTGAPVVAFEFDPTGLARIARNLINNPELAELVEVRQAYVADEVDEAHGVDTLDHLVERDGIAEPGLLKIDVEGAELKVLRGARALLERRRPHVILETHSAELEAACAELLLAHGYAPRIVPQRRRLRERRPAEHNRWLVARGA